MNNIPKAITVSIEEKSRVSKTIEDFFVETKEFVEQVHGLNNPSYFEVKSGNVNSDSLQMKYGTPLHLTNDRVTYLLYKDKVLASVLETRTEFNHVRYTFFRDVNQ